MDPFTPRIDPLGSSPLETMMDAMRAASTTAPADEEALRRALEASKRDALEQERQMMEQADLEAALEASRKDNSLRFTNSEEEMELVSVLSDSAAHALAEFTPRHREEAVMRAHSLTGGENMQDISSLERELQVLKADVDNLEAAIIEGGEQFRAAWGRTRETALAAASESVALAAVMEQSNLEKEHSTLESNLNSALRELKSQLELKVVELERVRENANREQREIASVVHRLGGMLEEPSTENSLGEEGLYVRRPLEDITPPPPAAEEEDTEPEPMTEEEQMEEALRMSLLAEDRRIQEEQNREYELALQKDEARRREEEALEDERRKYKEEEEIFADIAAFKTAQAQAALESKRDSFPAEPEAELDGVCNISVRLPNGARVKRRFLRRDRLQLIYDFVCVLGIEEDFRDAIPPSFVLVADFPRRQFDNLSLTIDEADLCGALVFVLPTD